MIVAFDVPLPIGFTGIGSLLNGEQIGYKIVREATFEELLEDINNPDIIYPPSTRSPEEQITYIKSRLHFFYEVSVD